MAPSGFVPFGGGRRRQRHPAIAGSRAEARREVLTRVVLCPEGDEDVNDADIHEQFDRFANGEVHVGELPPWTRVRGRAAWYVAQGPYSDLGGMWAEFMSKVRASNLSVTGPPGDVYVDDPEDHQADGQRRLITILWAPMKD